MDFGIFILYWGIHEHRNMQIYYNYVAQWILIYVYVCVTNPDIEHL